VEAYIEKRKTDADAHDRRGPIPVIPRVDPVSIMVGDIPEGLRRNPCLLSIPVSPAAHGERRPPYGHGGRPPEPAIPAFVGDRLPPSILFEGIGLVVKAGGKIFYRLSSHRVLGQPEVLPNHVPSIPIGIDGSFA